jgi:fatty-acyl-CoA synthase
MANISQTGPTNISILMRAIRRYADRPVLCAPERIITYRQMGDWIGRAQVALHSVGGGTDTFIAVLGRNGAEAWMTGQAVHAMGGRLCNLHPMGSLADHLRVIDRIGARHLVVDASSYNERGQEIAAARPELKVYSLGVSDFGPNLLQMMEAAGSTTMKDMSDPLAIMGCTFTGGTTGEPKMITARHRRFSAGNLAFNANFELPPVPRVLATGPITHVTGSLLFPTFMRGGSVHMLTGFNPQEVVKTIEQERINTTLMVPTMIYTLLDSPALRDADMSSLDMVLYSASPMSPSRLVEAVDRLGPVFAQLYAQSEIGPITYMPKADHDPNRPERFGACGFPVPECEVRLLDDAGNEVPAGEAGEICARAPYAFEGYQGNEEATAEALRDGWVHTGDIARMDEEGRLFIVDRKKDMIVSGGFNVYPREVEDVIATLHEVSACAVIGEPHARWGEAVCAYVVLKPGASLAAEAVMQQVKASKGSVYAPKEVHFVDNLPLTPAGKIDKKPLRAKAWSGSDRMVH